MGYIDKILAPNGTNYDLKDTYKSGIYTVIGTQTASTASWTGALHGVSALYDGLTINYYLPYAGVASTSVTLNLTLDSGSTTGAKNCYINTSRLTTHYGAGRTIVMTYYSAGSISIAGTATTDDRWICDAYYDTNSDTKVRQTLSTTNKNYPLLLSYAESSNTTTNIDNVSYRANTIYANPSTGNIQATQLNGVAIGSSPKFTDTTYSAGSGLTLSGTTFNVGKRWKAITQGQKWSRIYFAEPVTATVGTSGFLSVGCTRGSVVCNATFFITAAHNGASYSNCQEIASCNYTQVRVRLVIAGNSKYYFEIYDTAASIASGTTQEWQCCFIPLTDATLTCYTTFTDGTTIPSGYTATNDFTTTGGNAASAIKAISRSGTTFTATRQDGSTFTFSQQDNNTTYTFANGTNGFTVTPSGGTAQTVTVTPSITNNVTGSGTSGYLTKWNGTNTVTNGPQLGSSTTTYLNNAGSWATPPDTKNTAGSTDTSSKIFLIGATSQAANPQTYSDDQLYVTSGALQAKTVSAAQGVNANTGNANNAGGVSLYSTTPTSYGIAMRGTGSSTGQLGKHGYVQGDWAGYFCFSGDTNRGWIFNHAGLNRASISGLGNAVFNGSVTVGGNNTNTSGCRMEYNSTTQSLDFIFT